MKRKHVEIIRGALILSGLTLGAVFLLASIVRGLDPPSAIAGAAVLASTVYIFK